MSYRIKSYQNQPFVFRHPRIIPLGVVVLSVIGTLWAYAAWVLPLVHPSVIYVPMSAAMQQARIPNTDVASK